MNKILRQFLIVLSLLCVLEAQGNPILKYLNFELVDQVEQRGMVNTKIREYSELLSLDPASIQNNCDEVNKEYQKSIEAYNFVSTFSTEEIEETLQNIGKLRTLSNELQQQATATFESEALKDQLQETRIQHRLEELQWRVNWSASAESSDVPEEQIKEMKEEISAISGDKQKELDQIIEQKTEEQNKIIEQIQLGEGSYNKMKEDKDDLNAQITVLNDRIQDNRYKYQETIEANASRGDKLNTLYLQLKFFDEKKKTANTFEAIKQLSLLSMQTQEQINEIISEIEKTNQTVAMIQEQNKQTNDSLITKQAQLQQIELQMETTNTQLLQIKHDSDEVTNLIEKTKEEQAILLSQIKQKENDKVELNFEEKLQNQQQSFLQLNSNKNMFRETEKELHRTQQRIEEEKKIVEQLEKEEKTANNNVLRAQTKLLLITSKLGKVKGNGEKVKLELELKKVNKEFKDLKTDHFSIKDELQIQKKLLLTYETFEKSLKDEKSKSEEPSKLELHKQKSGEQQAIHLKSKEGPVSQKQVKVTQKGATKTKSGLSTSTSPAAPTITTTFSKKKISKSTVVPVGSKAPRKLAYPVFGKKSTTTTTTTAKVTTESLKDINPAVEGERRGKSVNGIKELILKYEELITLKEQYLEQQLKIVMNKEKVVTKRESEIKAAKEKIRKAVEKCNKEKKNIIQSAKQERESKEYKKALDDARKRLNVLGKKLKQEMEKEAVILKKKKIMEAKEKKLQEKTAELDKIVEQIEKKIFESSAQKKKTQFIEIAEDIHTIPQAENQEQPKLIEKDETTEPKTEVELIKQELKLNQQLKQAEVEKEIVKLDEVEVEKKELEIEQKQKQLEQMQADTVKEMEQVNEDINKCKLILNSGNKESSEYQVCELQLEDYEKKFEQLQQVKEDYSKEMSEFEKEKEDFYSEEANNLMYSFAEVNIEQQQQLLQFSDSNKKSLSKSIRHADGMVYLLQSAEKLSDDLKAVLLSIPDNRDKVKVTLKEVIDEISKLYETAILQRNLKQRQSVLLQKQRVLSKLQSKCLQAQTIHQDQQQ